MAKFKIFFGFAYILIFLLAIAGFVFAQRQLEVNYPEIGGIKPTVTTISLPEYIKYIFNISIALAGLIAFAVLVYAGFRYLTSAGNAAAIQDAKERISGALLGLLVLFGSYLILTTINPQLTFFDLPELQSVTIPPSTPAPAEEGVLHYTEIPVGGLIADAFSETRISRIKNVLTEITNASEKVKTISEELEGPTSRSKCGNTSPNCGMWDMDGKTQIYIHCGGGICTGNPCPEKELIQQKRAELQEANSVLGDWRQKLIIELNGIKKVYQDLLDAENRIKSCSDLPSPQGKKQKVMDYGDFWQYREFLEKEKLIKKTEATRPYGDYIKTDNPYNSATFYCTEQFYSAPASLSFSGEQFKGTLEGLPDFQEKQPFLKKQGSSCGPEIPIGEITDNSQELAQKIISKMEGIQNSVLTEITIANSLYDITEPTEKCLPTNCHPRSGCWIECDCPESGGFNPFQLIPEVKAQGCGEECSEICHYAKGPCSGTIFDNIAISQLVNLIKETGDDIVKQMSSLTDLLENRSAEDRLKISNIFEKLNISKNKIGVCYNSAETLRNFYQGKKVILQNPYSCSQVKLFAESQVPVYSKENNQPITDCYSGQGKADNYFCCSSEVNLSP